MLQKRKTALIRLVVAPALTVKAFKFLLTTGASMQFKHFNETRIIAENEG
jgi:hypothetical protein